MKRRLREIPASTWFAVGALAVVIGANTNLTVTLVVLALIGAWVAWSMTREPRREAGRTAIMWLSRTPRRFYGIVGTVLAVVGLATLLQLQQTYQGVTDTAAEVARRVAESNAQQQASADGPFEGTAQIPATTTPTRSPSASPSATATAGTDDPRKVTRKQKDAAVATGRRFVVQWLTGPRAKSTDAWMRGFWGYTVSDIRPLLASSRTAIPRTRVAGVAGARIATGAGDVTVKLRDRSTIIVGLTWDAADARWRVVDYQPGPRAKK